MLKRLIFPVLLVLAWSLPGLAQEKEQEIVFKKVAVLPFAVVSKTPMDTLGEKVRQDLLDRLKTDGFTLVPQEDLNRELAKIEEPLTDALAQDVGRKVGADIVVLGQLIIVGEALALEAKLLDLSGRPTPAARAWAVIASATEISASVRAAVYLSVFAIPFLRVYLPQSGPRFLSMIIMGT